MQVLVAEDELAPASAAASRSASSASSRRRCSYGRPWRSRSAAVARSSAPRPRRSAATSTSSEGARHSRSSAAAIASSAWSSYASPSGVPGTQRSIRYARDSGSWSISRTAPCPSQKRSASGSWTLSTSSSTRDLQHRLGAVREPDGRDELRERREERLAELELPGKVQCAPSARPAACSTVSSGKRAARSAAQASASSAQTITVGPEPESVAPAAPRGRSARIASRSGEGRYGWCRRSSNAAASRSASPRGDPCAEQRRARDVEGRVGVRDLVRQREPRLRRLHLLARDHGDRRERQRVGDPRDLPVPGEAGAAGEAGGQVVGVTLERRRRARAGPRARAPAPSTSPPRPSRARSSPRSSRARARAGSGRPTRTTALPARRPGRTRGCRCAPGRAARRRPRSPRPRSRGRARPPAQSKPGPRFAEVAGRAS